MFMLSVSAKYTLYSTKLYVKSRVSCLSDWVSVWNINTWSRTMCLNCHYLLDVTQNFHLQPNHQRNRLCHCVKVICAILKQINGLAMLKMEMGDRSIWRWVYGPADWCMCMQSHRVQQLEKMVLPPRVIPSQEQILDRRRVALIAASMN